MRCKHDYHASWVSLFPWVVGVTLSMGLSVSFSCVVNSPEHALLVQLSARVACFCRAMIRECTFSLIIGLFFDTRAQPYYED